VIKMIYEVHILKRTHASGARGRSKNEPTRPVLILKQSEPPRRTYIFWAADRFRVLADEARRQGDLPVVQYGRGWSRSFVVALQHPRRRGGADPLACGARNGKRDPPPARRCLVVYCSALAAPRLAMGRVSAFANEALGMGLSASLSLRRRRSHSSIIDFHDRGRAPPRLRSAASS
jgi:hypothetical protein